MLRLARAPVLLATLLAALLSSGCVRLTWNRQTVNLPVPDHVIDSLAPGDELEDLLAALGAPLFVRELPEGEKALAYGWLNERNLGVNVSVPVADNFSASVDYDRIDRRVKGVVLFLDADWRLALVRRGALADLLEGLPRQPPALPPDVLRESRSRSRERQE